MSSLSPSPSIGGYQGMLIAPHVVPEGSKVFEMKVCENCACAFMRKRKPMELCVINKEIVYRDKGQRYCLACQRVGLVPVDLSEYKEQFPGTANQMRHSIPVPKTDDSLTPLTPRRNPQRRGTGVKRKLDWRERLYEHFALHPEPMTAYDMALTVGIDHSRLTSAMSQNVFPAKMVGHVWPRVGRGVGRALYVPDMKQA